MNAYESVKQTILTHHLIKPGDVLLLGLSGGPDSLSLLHILWRMQKDMDFTLRALHVNHMIRGAEADADEAFVTEYCSELDVPLKSVKADIPGLSAESGISLEEQGRIERQKALSEEKENIEKTLIKNSSGMAKIVLAHNQDDQAETVLLRILRGTGIHGIAAMEYERADGIIRPLLDTARIEIEKYCRDNELSPRVDRTNSENDYTRNKIRNILLPEMSQYNPNIKESLVRLAASAREDDDYINSAVNSALEEMLCSSDESKIVINAKKLNASDPALFARLVKLAFSKIGLNEDIAAVHISALKKALLTNIGNKTIEFPHCYTAHLNHGKLSLNKPEKSD